MKNKFNIYILNKDISNQTRKNSSSYTTITTPIINTQKCAYYKFNCKCKIEKKFITFSDYLEHTINCHDINNLKDNLKKITTNFNNKKRGIKFY